MPARRLAYKQSRVRAVVELDFRSDTVTRPTPSMRAAMVAAPVGDDVMGEDPTIRELERLMAERLGMEESLFVPSGTMGNQIAVWVHTGRQGQVVCESRCHIALYEGGGAGLVSGATVRTVEGKNGVFTPEQVEDWVYPDDPHFAQTRMVAIENTHNWSGGRLWGQRAYEQVRDATHAAGAKFHVDGARIFNAEVASGRSAAQLLDGADSAMVCLSKGLGAPVGSMLAGSSDFIHQARRVRKVLGGGMRQAGIIASAGIYALEHNVARLADDHALARALATGLDSIDGITVDAATVETNMVLADVSALGMNGPDFCDAVKGIGIGCLPRDNGPMARFVTHLDVTQAQVDEALIRLQDFVKALK